MSWTLGRLALDDPTAFPEAVGEGVARVGATPVPGGRAGLQTQAGLESFTPGTSTVANRQRARRQLRSLLNNLPCRLAGLYLAWTEDGEMDGWYVPGTATFDVAGPGALGSAFWRFQGVELTLVGRPRTHRRAVQVYLRDRRLATTPRDTLRRVYSTHFSGMSPWTLTWLPSTVTDAALESTGATPTLSSARSGQGGASIRAVVGATDLAVVSFEQAAANRSLGDVVIMDRRGTITAPTGGADAAWEEVYGRDWPLTSGDVPVVENSIVRVRWSSANTPGFALDRWSGSAWVEEGKVLVRRDGDTTGFCDTLISADVVEWTPERGVVRAIVSRAADALSREEVFLTLQRGWTGPRVEVYPAPKSGGAAAGGGVFLFRSDAPAGTETANKFDAALQTTSGAPSFTEGAAVGAATFTGENWLVMRNATAGYPALILAVLQNTLTAAVRNSTSAYGAARNGISVNHATAGYVGAHIGMNDRSDTTAIDAAAGTTYDGSRDLGKEILLDSRSPQVIVSRVGR